SFQTGIIVDSETIFTLKELETTNMIVKDVTKSSLLLWEIAGASVGFSGRTLRKIPFLAHALYAETPLISLSNFLSALQMAIKKQKQDRVDIGLVKNH
ncbi:Pachytene checkpoint protein 2-like 1, partial [Homarus americanus]